MPAFFLTRLGFPSRVFLCFEICDGGEPPPDRIASKYGKEEWPE